MRPDEKKTIHWINIRARSQQNVREKSFSVILSFYFRWQKQKWNATTTDRRSFSPYICNWFLGASRWMLTAGCLLLSVHFSILFVIFVSNQCSIIILRSGIQLIRSPSLQKLLTGVNSRHKCFVTIFGSCACMFWIAFKRVYLHSKGSNKKTKIFTVIAFNVV